jgi:hypothetical protein
MNLMMGQSLPKKDHFAACDTAQGFCYAATEAAEWRSAATMSRRPTKVVDFDRPDL